MPENDGDPHHDPKAATAAIKALHAAGGRALTGEEVVALILQPFNLGRPKAPSKHRGAPGPKNKKTQYDHALDRRLDLYRRLVMLPKLGRAAGWEARPEYVATLQAVLANKAIPGRQKAAAVLTRLARHGQAAPTERTVRRHLKTAMGFKAGK